MPELHSWPTEDVLLQPASERFRLCPCRPGSIEGFIVSSRPDNLKAHTGLQACGTTLWTHLQSNIARLNMGTTFEQSIEYIVHRTQHGSITAEICGQGLDHPLIRFNLLNNPIERFNIGTSKSIDRLFGVTHDKKFSRFEHHLSPIRRVLAYTLGHSENNLVLHRIGILELIHKNSTILLLDPLSNDGVVAEQRTGAREQAVKRKPSLLHK